MQKIIDDFGNSILFKTKWVDFLYIQKINNTTFQSMVGSEIIDTHNSLQNAIKDIEDWIKEHGTP